LRINTKFIGYKVHLIVKIRLQFRTFRFLFRVNFSTKKQFT